ncbi:MAG: hypothetical protein Q9168_005764 [Polycauliona sp. 1 TL-2023]
MTAPNPMVGSMEGSISTPAPAASRKTFTIAGILVTVFGLEELSPSARKTACLWLLHPRLQTQECMGPLAAVCIDSWNHQVRSQELGLLAVTFDQRNHGSREVDPLSNEAWRSGNKQHAQDMFSIYQGTSSDVSLLMTYLSSYIFPSSNREIVSHLVLGVSLGGHAAWQYYLSLMSDRAQLSKLPSWTESSPPGTNFLGSPDFPAGLLHAVGLYDPAAILVGNTDHPVREISKELPSRNEQARLLPLMSRMLQGKRILNLSGAADKLVPYRCSQAFVDFLKRTVAPGSWFPGGLYLEDLQFDGVGHQMSPEMVAKTVGFVADTLLQIGDVEGSIASKI